ncbi:hypothetical protein M8I34_32245 [Streptomyces sp. MCA2]|uniref:hypothetical protein n=1 Tax=Streptomyces sp. MCA2 TaxID=2944805 RepID=UPI00202142B3|nr:hypothetical protein [Streptomyces sp. MCA2]MCL7496040.1 hypothetical protein [Streptomyces sp. MCA2]
MSWKPWKSYTSGGDAEDFMGTDHMTEAEKRHAWPGDYDDEYEYEEDYEEEEKPPLETEWQYLRERAHDLEADLASLKVDSESKGLGMEPHGRLRKAMDAASHLLASTPHERLANAVERELEYVRYGLDKHREWMGRELGRRGRDRERDKRERERDAETRSYRNAVVSRSKGYTPPSGIRQLEKDLERARHPNYRLPRTGD